MRTLFQSFSPTKDSRIERGSSGLDGSARIFSDEIRPNQPDPLDPRSISPRSISPLVRIDNVIKDYESGAGPVRVLRGVSLDVWSGEFVAVVGPSGSGKSTLINMITGIDRPSAGEVVVAGARLNDLSESAMARWRGRTIGVIFQFFQLLPALTVLENVMLPMDFCNTWPTRERKDRALALLEQVEMADQAHKLPSAISGGQKQRAAIARALANDPPLLVGDEPTGNLDSRTADRVFELFNGLVAQGKTLVMVTHDREIAQRAPRIVRVEDGHVLEAKG
ncbi:MAG: ABC transporter ATP-binding protein [Caldilineaceae bacterium]